MQVKRIIANIAASNPADATTFYQSVFGLELVMDHGWIKTFSSGEKMLAQISIASEGGSGTAVPGLSIEVDDLEAVLQTVKAKHIPIEYGPVIEPWGVRRFYIRDPFGTLINVLQHQ
ncbi:VOC family protein [Rheinheimera hassiensis]|uniref:VOC family protein n=1 Tax=Rheinheimera hassiensis TaxID=1193627 RepID=UPI001F069A4A|nr:VOC family protein [Rheinheimera hassiensis]